MTARSIDGPDGRYRIEVVSDEVRAHMVAEHSRIVDAHSAEILLDLWAPELWRWDGRARFVGPARVRIELRRFAHSPGPEGALVAGADRELCLLVDLDRRTFAVERGALDDADFDRALRARLKAAPSGTGLDSH